MKQTWTGSAFFHQWECLKCNGHGHSVSCVKSGPYCTWVAHYKYICRLIYIAAEALTYALRGPWIGSGFNSWQLQKPFLCEILHKQVHRHHNLWKRNWLFRHYNMFQFVYAVTIRSQKHSIDQWSGAQKTWKLHYSNFSDDTPYDTWMMDEFIHRPYPYLLLSATCVEMLPWMIEIWMKTNLVSDSNCNTVDL